LDFGIVRILAMDMEPADSPEQSQDLDLLQINEYYLSPIPMHKFDPTILDYKLHPSTT